MTTQRLAELGQPSTPVTTNRIASDEPVVAEVAAAPVEPTGPDVDVTVDTDPDLKVAADTPLDKPVTGTGPNLVKPPKQPKNGWKPGDLLRSIFGPKPTADAPSATASNSVPTVPATEPTTGTGGEPAAPSNANTGVASSGSAP